MYNIPIPVKVTRKNDSCVVEWADGNTHNFNDLLWCFASPAGLHIEQRNSGPSGPYFWSNVPIFDGDGQLFPESRRKPLISIKNDSN